MIKSEPPMDDTLSCDGLMCTISDMVASNETSTTPIGPSMTESDNVPSPGECPYGSYLSEVKQHNDIIRQEQAHYRQFYELVSEPWKDAREEFKELLNQDFHQ